MIKSETWDLIDAGGTPLGETMRKGSKHPEGTYHKVVGIWVISPEGKALLTKRSSQKLQFPGLWENTGGCVLAGETGPAGAVRELFEETGIKTDIANLCYLGSLLEKTALAELYGIHVDRELHALPLQEAEVEEMKWVTKAEWNEMCLEHKISQAAFGRMKQVEEELERFGFR